MKEKLILILLICFKNIIEGSTSKYIVRPSNEDFLQKCPGYENNFYDKYFDLSKLKFERISEDVIEASGIIKYIGNLPADAVITGEVKFYRKLLGNWIETVGLYRENLCSVLFKATEPWYSITSIVDEKDRKCPPDARFQTKVNKVKLEYILDGTAMDFEGDFRIITILRYGRKELLCSMSYVTIVEME